MATIEKIVKDIQTTKAKIAELQKKVRTLEAQKVEEENLQIVKMVKTVNLDNKTLTAVLKAFAKGDITLPEAYKAELQKENKQPEKKDAPGEQKPENKPENKQEVKPNEKK